MSSLAEALPTEINRVREVVIPIFEALRSMPNTIVEPQIIMKYAVSMAIKACASGDIIAMLQWYEELKGMDA